MVVTVVSNAFRGGPEAAKIARALGRGARAAGGDVRVREFALSDGGDGATRAAAAFTPGRELSRPVRGPAGARGQASFRLMSDGTALVETAAASGLGLLRGARTNPLAASTWGTGELVAAAVESGAKAVLLGAGGSATTDMGAGALGALGAVFRDSAGRPLRPHLAGLDGLDSVSLSAAQARLAAVPVTVLSDVDTPLRDSLAVYGPQKGFRATDERRVASTLLRLERAFGFQAGELLGRRWLGAGGGIAAGFSAAFGAGVTSGSSWFVERSGARASIARSDLVLTAEGRFDRGSLAGKLPYTVAATAVELGVPVTLVAASVGDDARLPSPARLVDLKLPRKEPGNRMDAVLEHRLGAASAAAVRERMRERLAGSGGRAG
jgi:glycerate 2-kinase